MAENRRPRKPRPIGGISLTQGVKGGKASASLAGDNASVTSRDDSHNVLNGDPSIFDPVAPTMGKEEGESAPPVRGVPALEPAPKLVRALYRALLLREPDSDGLERYASDVREGLPIEEIIRRLLSSPEFARNYTQFLRTYLPSEAAVERVLNQCGQDRRPIDFDFLAELPCILNFEDDWRDSTQRYYAAIEASGISLDSVAESYASEGLTQEQYTCTHLRRFHELFSYFRAQLSSLPHKAELLEIGTAAHTTRFYRKFLQCRYDTICRPSNLGGPPQQWAIEAGSENHWEIDLNCLERYANMLAEMPSSTYDVVVCCEVIEHLTRAPRELIRFALSKLKPTGFLYLTTPNFLTPANIRRIHVGRNPNAEFDKYYDNIDAHQHFREYTPRELVDEVVGAGGVAREVIFSNCWDYPRFSDVQELMFRSNLVMVINRQEA